LLITETKTAAKPWSPGTVGARGEGEGLGVRRSLTEKEGNRFSERLHNRELFYGEGKEVHYGMGQKFS